MKFKIREGSSERDWYENVARLSVPDLEEGALGSPQFAERWMELLDRGMEQSTSLKFVFHETFHQIYSDLEDEYLPLDYIGQVLLLVLTFWEHGDKLLETDEILTDLEKVFLLNIVAVWRGQMEELAEEQTAMDMTPSSEK